MPNIFIHDKSRPATQITVIFHTKQIKQQNIYQAKDEDASDLWRVSLAQHCTVQVNVKFQFLGDTAFGKSLSLEEFDNTE